MECMWGDFLSSVATRQVLWRGTPRMASSHAPPPWCAHTSQEPNGQVATRHVLMTRPEFEAHNVCKAPAGKRYFNHVSLPDIVHSYPMKAGLVVSRRVYVGGVQTG